MCLLDLAGRKINFYRYDGEFIKSKALPFLFSSFAYIDSTTMAFDLQTALNKEQTDVNNYYLVTADPACGQGTKHNWKTTTGCVYGGNETCTAGVTYNSTTIRPAC